MALIDHYQRTNAFVYISNLFQGNWGYSISNKRDVFHDLVTYFTATGIDPRFDPQLARVCRHPAGDYLRPLAGSLAALIMQLVLCRLAR
jgi:hypothetical protein